MLMTDQSPALRIGNPLAIAKAAVPSKLRLDGHELLWTHDDSLIDEPTMGFKEGGLVDGALWRFLELRNASDQECLAFANRYGVLALREDGLPGTAADRRQTTNVYPSPEQDENDVWWFREDLRAWRMYAVALRGVLAFALHLTRRPEQPLEVVLRDADLADYDFDSFGLPMSAGESISEYYVKWISFLSPGHVLQNLARNPPETRRMWLSWYISSTWIEYACLRPVLTWEDDQPRMVLSLGSVWGMSPLPPNSLFSVLIAQLAAVVTTSSIDLVDQCTVCGRLFEAAIKPGRHERAFCPEHKIERDRERRRRWARKAAAQKRAKVPS